MRSRPRLTAAVMDGLLHIAALAEADMDAAADGLDARSPERRQTDRNGRRAIQWIRRMAAVLDERAELRRSAKEST